MNFQSIWIPKGFWQKFCQKKAGLGKHSYLKYALTGSKENKKVVFQNKSNIRMYTDTILYPDILELFISSCCIPHGL